MQTFDTLDGAVLVDKPVGPTSHDVVDQIRRRFGIKKVGHCGTLDPNASGLLVIVLGRATKLSEKLMATDKTYEGTARFGETTSSYDIEGEVLQAQPVPPLTLEQLNALAGLFVGDQMQTPPMVSAVKVKGVPLYKLARRGLEVERKAKLIHVYRFQFQQFLSPLGFFDIACTKGTYVRGLVHDLGQKVGCGACLAALRRLASGKFAIEDAIPLEQLLSLRECDLQKRVIPFLKLAA